MEVVLDTARIRPDLVDGTDGADRAPDAARPLPALGGSRATPLHAALWSATPASTAAAGQAFNLQPDSLSALAVACGRAGERACILFGGVPLASTLRRGDLATALMPPDLFDAPGLREVRLMDESGLSNALEFRVDE